MSRQTVFGALVALPLLLVGAAPNTDALMRGAHAALARGDLPAAAALYEQAELRTTDPGAVAFDLGAVKQQLAVAQRDPRLLIEAEQHFRACLDAANPRRAAAFFGIGNCLEHRAASHDADLLLAALEAFESCQSDPNATAELVAAARHNAERVRLLLSQRPSAERAPDPPAAGNESTSDPSTRLKDKERAPSTLDPTAGKSKPDGPAQVNHDGKGQTPQATTETAPGKGNLPPIPDRAELQPLSGADATTHLEQVAARIHAARQRALLLRASKAPAAGVRDW